MLETTQILPNYRDRYTDYPSWVVQETEQYIFHVLPGSLAEKELPIITETQERAHAHISHALRLSGNGKKIRYFFYPTEEDKKAYMGDDGFAQAIWHDHSIHAVYSPEDKVVGPHEDTHLLALAWGGSPIGFFAEGLAEHMSGCIWKGLDSTPLARAAMERNIFGSFVNLFTHRFWMDTPEEDCDLYYALAGTFSAYLFEMKGLSVYRDMYTSLRREYALSENIGIFEKHYGNLSEVVAGYRVFLNREA